MLGHQWLSKTEKRSLPSTRQHPSYGDCLDVKKEYYQRCSELGYATCDSQQHTYVSSSYRSNRLALSHWNSYAVRRGGCLELYYCNMMEWFWCDSSLISTTNWFPSVLSHCWFGHLACKNRPRNDVLSGTLSPTLLLHYTISSVIIIIHRLTSASSHVSTLLYIMPLDSIFPLPTTVVGICRTPTVKSSTDGGNTDGTRQMSVLRTTTPHAMYFLRPYRRRRTQNRTPPSSSKIATTVTPMMTPTSRSSSGREVVDDMSSSSDVKSSLEANSASGIASPSSDQRQHWYYGITMGQLLPRRIRLSERQITK